MVDSARGSRVQVYAQTMHQADRGRVHRRGVGADAVEVGVHGVVLGHSERRELFGETDRALQLKVPAALDAGLIRSCASGRPRRSARRGDTERKLRHQVQEDLAR